MVTHLRPHYGPCGAGYFPESCLWCNGSEWRKLCIHSSSAACGCCHNLFKSLMPEPLTICTQFFFFSLFFSSSFFAHNRWTMGNDQWSYKGWIPFTIFISQKCYVHTVYQVYIHTVCVYGCVCVSFCWLNVKNYMCYHMKVSSASASAFFLLILLANQIKYFLDLACTLWKSGLFGRSWALLSCY